MTITDEDRFHLHQRLETVLGSEEASTLMEHLPPVGWADVATRRDLDHFSMVSRQELDLAGAGLRLEIASVKAELKGDIAELRTELKGDIAALRAEMDARFVSTERHLRTWLIGSQAVMLTILGLLVQLH